jgi:hypothetical protein
MGFIQQQCMSSDGVPHIQSNSSLWGAHLGAIAEKASTLHAIEDTCFTSQQVGICKPCVRRACFKTSDLSNIFAELSVISGMQCAHKLMAFALEVVAMHANTHIWLCHTLEAEYLLTTLSRAVTWESVRFILDTSCSACVCHCDRCACNINV